MDDNLKKEMGSRIRSLREKRGMSQDELASTLGMNRTNVSNYESGRTVPPGNVISKLADVLHTNSDYLLARTEDPTQTAAQSLTAPEWATAKDKRDFKKMLEEDTPIMFDGKPLSNEDKQRIKDILTGFFWEAKEMNKKTWGKGRKSGKDNNEITDKQT